LFTVQVTAVSFVSVTCKVVTPPVAIAVLSGEIEIVTAGGGGGGGGGVEDLEPELEQPVMKHRID
jgi:hypothetical protein